MDISEDYALALLLRSLRIKRGLTLKKVAFNIGVNYNAYTQYVRAKRTPSTKKLNEMIKALGHNAIMEIAKA